jgi:hypothetical protein
MLVPAAQWINAILEALDDGNDLRFSLNNIVEQIQANSREHVLLVMEKLIVSEFPSQSSQSKSKE